jgi:hypothetical protein
MILTVLLQAIVQFVTTFCFLLPLSIVFAVISIVSNGNAVADPRGIFITGARYVRLFQILLLVVL